MIFILRRVRGGGVVSVSRGRSSCPVSLGLEYDGSGAYSRQRSSHTIYISHVCGFLELKFVGFSILFFPPLKILMIGVLYTAVMQNHLLSILSWSGLCSATPLPGPALVGGNLGQFL